MPRAQECEKNDKPSECKTIFPVCINLLCAANASCFPGERFGDYSQFYPTNSQESLSTLGKSIFPSLSSA